MIVDGSRRLGSGDLDGFWTQVYAPADRDVVALEPMTAPTDALASGRGLTIAAAGERFRVSFRIRVAS